MRAWMLTLFVLMLTAMRFTMAAPEPVDAAEAESNVNSNIRQKRQFVYGYPSYSYIYGYGYPTYGRLYYPFFYICG